MEVITSFITLQLYFITTLVHIDELCRGHFSFRSFVENLFSTRMQTLVLLPELLLNTRFERVKYISTQQMN